MDTSEVLRQAETYHRQGRLLEAQRLYESVAAADPTNFVPWHRLSTIKLQQGSHSEALGLVEQALARDPHSANALSNRGVILHALGRFEEALASYDRALSVAPEDVDVHFNRGNSLLLLGRYQETLEAFDRVLQAHQGDGLAQYNRANALLGLERFDEAQSGYRRALARAPELAGDLCRRGAELQQQSRLPAAQVCFEQVLEANPRDMNATHLLGVIKAQQGDHLDALRLIAAAAKQAPNVAIIKMNYANVCAALGRHEEALASYDAAIGLEPDRADAHNNRVRALRGLRRFEEALASLDRCLALNPDHAEAHYNRGLVLMDLNRLDEALASLDRALSLDPKHFTALANYVASARSMCDWSAAQRAEVDLIDACRLGSFEGSSFYIVRISDDLAVQRAAAENYVRARASPSSPPLRPNPVSNRGKLRIGYLSADFRQHPTSVLIAELIELHDRSRFEVFGFSAGPDDGSALRTRLQGAFDTFVDVGRAPDAELQQTIRKAQIDIIVDLGGHTEEGRILALAQRTAPIQVTYLGYPGTVGAQFIDYAIVDKFVVPDSAAEFFTEKLASLPHCYQVNDRKRVIGERIPSRAECGLPPHGFVFCSFNAPHKIARTVFDHWMRILIAVPGSVLWLLADNTWARDNLRKEAKLRGVDPERLVFASRATAADHLARQRLADLFLDTWPYNAHTTASDALWVGLPVLTYSGRCFAARVAGSLLHAVGLPELVTNSLTDYEALAIALAHDPARIATIRGWLARNRLTAPLFDTDLFRRHIETAYLEMWRLYNSGESPRSFAVPA